MLRALTPVNSKIARALTITFPLRKFKSARNARACNKKRVSVTSMPINRGVKSKNPSFVVPKCKQFHSVSRAHTDLQNEFNSIFLTLLIPDKVNRNVHRRVDIKNDANRKKLNIDAYVKIRRFR